MNNAIKYSNLKVLSEDESKALKSIIEKECPRITRLFQEPSDLIVDVKIAHKDKRKRYTISLRLETASKVYSTRTKDTEVAADYDIVKATHKILAHLMNEVKNNVRKEEDVKKSSFKSFFRIFKND